MKNVLNYVIIKDIKLIAIMFNSFQAIAPLTANKKGQIFGGAYFPQKLTPKSSIETQTVSVQGHVLSYMLKRSKGCFVCVQRTA
jgi:hypothetical protein